MLTIFALPKPFRGHFNIIQRNAIQSWMRLSPRCEIILVGDEEGTREVAAELGLRHLPKVDRNEHGTPLLDSVFAASGKAATYPHLCYVNSDIILMNDFLPAVQYVLGELREFLLVGRRWDLDVTEPLPFDDGWETRLKVWVKAKGRLRPHGAIDYFVFPRGLWTDIPPFAIGRTIWDQWLIYSAVSHGAPVVDLTQRVMIVHQNHSYATAGGLEAIEKSPEGRRNLELAGGYSHACNLWDAQYKLTRRGIRRRRSPYVFYRELVKLSDRNAFALSVFKIVRVAIEAARR